jgi:hypothetical protein
MFDRPEDSASPKPAPVAPPAAPSEDISTTPSLTLPADVATRLKGDHQCKPGDRYTLTVSVKAVGEDGSLTLDVPQDAEFTPAQGPLGDSALNSEDDVDRFAGPTVLKGVGKSLID